MCGAPSNDLGLKWGSSWQAYRDRIVAATQSWSHTGESGTHALAHGVVYDLLYQDLSASERSQLHGWIIALLDTKTKLKWQSEGGHWDDQTSDEHTARVILSIAADDGAARAARAFQESSDYAAAHEAMQYAEGLGYAWKDQTVANLGPLLSLWILKNAMGLTDADTIDRLPRLVPRYLATRAAVHDSASWLSIGHRHWKQARVNFQAPDRPQLPQRRERRREHAVGTRLVAGEGGSQQPGQRTRGQAEACQQRGRFLRVHAARHGGRRTPERRVTA